MTEVARRVAEQFGSRFLRSYARSKLRSDPVYRAVVHRLRGTAAPIFDIGCGVGLLEFFLRESGIENDVTAIDHDPRKIQRANVVAARYKRLTFRAGDARDPIPAQHNVVLVDVLHYFTNDDRQRILGNVAAAIPSGGMAIIRDAIRDGSLRYRLTKVQERFSRSIRWLRAERLNFPARDEITKEFAGFAQEILPMWGFTPFNNYLFVFRRSS